MSTNNTNTRAPFYKKWWFWTVVGCLVVIGLFYPSNQTEMDTTPALNEPTVSAEEIQRALNRCTVLEAYKNYEFSEERTQEGIFAESQSACNIFLGEKYYNNQADFVADIESAWIEQSAQQILNEPLTYYLELLEQEQNGTSSPADNPEEMLTVAVALRQQEQAKQKALAEQRQREEEERQRAEAERKAAETKATATKSAPSASNSVSSSQYYSTNGECKIKGNVNSKGEKIYHVPGGRYYDKTDITPSKGDRWFCTEQEAVNAGFRASKR